jgi:hypothetical protein
MAVRKIAISVPDEILTQVDRMAKSRKTTRSGFIADVLKAVSYASDQEAIRKQINQLFRDQDIREEQTSTSELFVRSMTKKYGETDW